jgi:hypothetical protein
VPNLSHLWQRFLLASSLLVGLAIGVAATVFGYSNLSTVDVRWSVFHIDAVPLWTLVVVPLALVLIAGTLYHWMNGLHHFTEHMRHRRRVHELEAEVASLRAHLDHVLEMPDHAALPARTTAKASLAEPAEAAQESTPPAAEALPDSAAAPVKSEGDRKKRARLTVAPEADAAKANGEKVPEAAESSEPIEPAAPAAGA